MVALLCACEKHDVASDRQFAEGKEEVASAEEAKSEKQEAAEQWEKGYDLPVDEQEREEAESDCKKVMGLISDIYHRADKGDASNVVLNDETIHEMQDRIKEKDIRLQQWKRIQIWKITKKLIIFLRSV